MLMHEAGTVIKRAVRLWQAWLITLVLLGTIYVIAPQQIGLLAYKSVFLTLGGVIGYWVHTWTFGHIEVGCGDEQEKWRRTVYMVGGMLAFALAA